MNVLLFLLFITVGVGGYFLGTIKILETIEKKIRKCRS